MLFPHELENLIRNFGLDKRDFGVLRHSWGRMLGSAYGCTQPNGLRRVIIANSPADVSDWEEAAMHLVKNSQKIFNESSSSKPTTLTATAQKCKK